MPHFRKLLFPFSVIYHGVTGLRNSLYDLGVLKSQNYEIPVICVGNLNVGGTGKSPMIEYLIDLLIEDKRVASLSRGYKRETRGFHLVSRENSVGEVGDEPLQFKTKFPEAIVAVDADRRNGIASLMGLDPEVILLDDAFQHRKLEAGFNILLSAYGDLFVDDLLLPAGNLRESQKGAKRANVIIVTKCPESLSLGEMSRIRQKINPGKEQQIYFTGIGYAEKVICDNSEMSLKEIPKESILVTGIANPRPLLDYLTKMNVEIEHHRFPDHHNFSDKEISKLARHEFILTTEKDYMRLKDRLPSKKLGYLPIRSVFLEGQKEFNSQILTFVNKK